MSNAGPSAVRPELPLVRQRFSDAAARYDEEARHQDAIAAALTARLPQAAPATVLEWGCGTGLLTRRLQARWPSCHITAVDLAPAMLERCRQAAAGGDVAWVEADAEHHQCEPAVDLLASSCALQWFRQPDRIADHAGRQVSAGGSLAAAIPVAGTLRELWESLARTGYAGPSGLALATAAEWLDRFRHPAWEQVRVETATFTEHYPSSQAALRAVQGIGANCTGHGGWQRLGAVRMRRLLAAYEAGHRSRSGVACSYAVAFVTARRTAWEHPS